MKCLKNYFAVILAVIAMTLSFTSCSDDDDNLAAELVGNTWVLNQVEYNGQWIDVTKPPYSYRFGTTYITFKSDGTYYGAGSFGNGKGTYKVDGKKVLTYVGGSLYFTCIVNSVKDGVADINMVESNGDSMHIICKKR